MGRCSFKLALKNHQEQVLVFYLHLEAISDSETQVLEGKKL